MGTNIGIGFGRLILCLDAVTVIFSVVGEERGKITKYPDRKERRRKKRRGRTSNAKSAKDEEK